MKKILIISALITALNINSAYADCPSGVCNIEINCTTGEITYTDATNQVQDNVPNQTTLQTTQSIYTISVQTTNQTWGTSGTIEQITKEVQNLAPKPLITDPCANGGCTKIEVNAQTGQGTILPLSDSEIKQRAKDQVEQGKQKAELAKNAYQALPNITPWQFYDPFKNNSETATILNTELTPDWWNSWVTSLNLFFENWFWWSL